MLKDNLKYLNSLKEKSDYAFPKKDWDSGFIEKLKIDLTYHSNKIEGSTLTYGDTIKFLEEGLLNPKRPGRDYIDIKHHQEVLDKIFLTYDEPLSVSVVKNLHHQLMRSLDQWGDDAFFSPGRYKIRDNYVMEKGGKLHKFLSIEKVEPSMEKLIADVNNWLIKIDLKETLKHPVFIASYFHHKFINIHPFEDGNGRMARILTNVILLKNNISPFVIKENERDQYFEAIKQTSDNNIDPTVDFFAYKIIKALEQRLDLLK